MNLQALELHSTGQPRNTMIVLHGLGADGHDFVPVCEALNLEAVGGVRFVLPNAPVIPISINGGMPMPAWYDIRGTALDREEDEGGLRRSCTAITDLIDAEIARGTPASRIVLMGFSQGCAMSLMTGLRYPQRLAGIVGLSGYLPLLPQTEAERHPTQAALPLFLAHGTRDPVVPLARAEAARDELLRLGHTPQWQLYPMQHEVCMDEIEDLNDFLLQVLA